MTAIRRCTTLRVSYESVSRLLSTRAHDVVAGIDVDRPSLSADLFGVHLSQPVEVEVGQAVTVEGPIETTVVPVIIHATEHGRLFPVLDAEFEVLPLRSSGVELALEGEYRVPGGLVGAAVDRTAFHHVAETAVDEFFNGVVERIRRGAAAYDALAGLPV
jgi:hypothetical protein